MDRIPRLAAAMFASRRSSLMTTPAVALVGLHEEAYA